MKHVLGITLTALALFGAATAPAAQTAAKAEAAPAQSDAEVIRAQKPSYPLTTCPVSGEKLDDTAVDAVVDGRLVRLCCNKCKGGVEKDKAAILAKIDAAVVAAQKAAYPLKTCPISGKELGDTAVDLVRGTKLVRVCCPKCVAGVDKDLAGAMAKVDQAWIEAQSKDYPLDVCPVSGEKLGSMGKPVEVLYGTTLVRLCCNSCKKSMEKDGPAIVARIAEARAKAKAK